MFIHKAEEEALGIDKNSTERYRRNNQIPDSDGFAMIMPRKREADQRQCPPISDKHDKNKPRNADIPEDVFE